MNVVGRHSDQRQFLFVVTIKGKRYYLNGLLVKESFDHDQDSPGTYLYLSSTELCVPKGCMLLSNVSEYSRRCICSKTKVLNSRDMRLSLEYLGLYTPWKARKPSHLLAAIRQSPGKDLRASHRARRGRAR